MHITSTPDLPGYRITEVLDVARGSTVRARNFGRDFTAAMRNLVGGELSEYTKLLAQAREQAIERMVDDAEALGADAVVNLRFTTSSVMGGAAEVLAYGTAVRVEKI